MEPWQWVIGTVILWEPQLVGGGVEERADLASCRRCVWRRVDVLLSLCGSLCRGGQLQLLGLYVVDGSVEASLISFEGVVVVGECGEAGALVVKFAEDGSKGGDDGSHLSSSLDSTALDTLGLSPDMLLGTGVVVGWRLGFAEVVA
jgi:hypothetical protein